MLFIYDPWPPTVGDVYGVILEDHLNGFPKTFRYMLHLIDTGSAASAQQAATTMRATALTVLDEIERSREIEGADGRADGLCSGEQRRFGQASTPTACSSVVCARWPGDRRFCRANYVSPGYWCSLKRTVDTVVHGAEGGSVEHHSKGVRAGPRLA